MLMNKINNKRAAEVISSSHLHPLPTISMHCAAVDRLILFIQEKRYVPNRQLLCVRVYTVPVYKQLFNMIYRSFIIFFIQYNNINTAEVLL